MKTPKNINELISEALAMEIEEAKEAGALGFMARSLVQATMPHRKAEGNEFKRTNGAFTLSMLAPSDIGLPYGSVPRILLAWLTTEAVKTKDREIVLGDSLSDFMRQLDMIPTGGRWGSITRLREQMTRLFSCFISCTYVDNNLTALKNIMVADKSNLWWEPKNPKQIQLFQSTVTLSQGFFDEVTQNPIPIDIRALKALQKSPLALDIYCWLTYRMSYLRSPVVIPWESLQMQFGSDYKLTRQFKAAFLDQLRKVKVLYPAVNAEDHPHGLLLKPSRTSITKTQIFLPSGDK
ncbi:replication protein RepA [Anaeromusa acidaminophila]|uniref:replication protein RepA n=1 Tax=Anaeromusa acidaminophila TaxID=81464 RepID=UPI00035C3FE3|nr:replication protein RepA [Anaeromusa acidaminophila]